MTVHTWNYRVIEFAASDEHYLAIHEVHYRDGAPWSYSERAAIVGWDKDENASSPHFTLDRMREALDRPVLLSKDFEP